MRAEMSADLHQLGDYTGNCCAFRCVEAVRSHFGIDTTIRNEVSLRLFFLGRLLKSWVETKNGAAEVQGPEQSIIGVPDPSQPLSGPDHAQSSSSESRNNPTMDAPELVVRTVPHQADTALTPVWDANSSESDDSTGHISASPCPKLARTPLPNVPTKQTSAGKTNSSRFSRKRSAEEFIILTQSPEEDAIGTESAEPPRKRKDKETPSLKFLAEELIGSDAIKRIRRHVLAHNRRGPVLSTSSGEHEDWAKKTCEFLNLADQWEEKSEFSRLVALIFRIHGVERIYIEARSILMLDKEDSVPKLPTVIIDRVSPYLQAKRTPNAFRTWLTLTRKLLKLGDYLPFMPFNSNGPATFRHYERLANEDIQQLRHLLDNDSRAQGLARIGRVFRDCILKRQAFLWEDISCEELSKLPDNTFLHLLTTRRFSEYERLAGVWSQPRKNLSSTKPDSGSKQCDLCEGRTCKLFALGRDLASKQSLSPARGHERERASSPDIAPQHNNTATGVGQIWTSETSTWSSTSLRAIDHNPSAVLLTSVDNSASSLQLPTCDAFWSGGYDQVLDAGPQLQLSLPRKVSDTAQSIEFAMRGNIDGLRYLFSLGLASPRDESHSRGFSLLRVSLATFSIPENYFTSAEK